METAYRPRIVDHILSHKLKGKGAIVIEGPKWCGKTTTAEQLAKSIIYVNSPEEINYYRQLVKISPQEILKGEKPLLLDEWQNIPSIWDSIRFDIDHTRLLGQFILTGSSIPADMSEVMHSGTGRFGWLKMRTMSLWESNDSNGKVSLRNLFDGFEISAKTEKSIEDIAYVTCRGGWPATVDMPKEIALDQAFDYVDAIVNRDIGLSDGKIRDNARVRRLMRSLARHQGSQISFAKISSDLHENENTNIHDDTVATYIRALERIFVIEDVEAWNPNLRSSTAIRALDTRYFSDPSIATASLGLGPKDLINDLNTFGFILETLCIRDLRIYAEPLNGKIYHYRDKNGLECDAICHLRDGRYGLIEIKLGGDTLIREGIKNLLKLKSNLDYTKMPQPSFLMIIVGVGKYAYKNEEGIYIVPISCLKD